MPAASFPFKPIAYWTPWTGRSRKGTLRYQGETVAVLITRRVAEQRYPEYQIIYDRDGNYRNRVHDY